LVQKILYFSPPFILYILYFYAYIILRLKNYAYSIFFYWSAHSFLYWSYYTLFYRSPQGHLRAYSTILCLTITIWEYYCLLPHKKCSTICCLFYSWKILLPFLIDCIMVTSLDRSSPFIRKNITTFPLYSLYGHFLTIYFLFLFEKNTTIFFYWFSYIFFNNHKLVIYTKKSTLWAVAPWLVFWLRGAYTLFV
jgi:hypothetical protein